MARQVQRLNIREDTYKPQSQSLLGEGVTAVGRVLENVEIKKKKKKENDAKDPTKIQERVKKATPPAKVPAEAAPLPSKGVFQPAKLKPRPKPSIKQPPATTKTRVNPYKAAPIEGPATQAESQAEASIFGAGFHDGPNPLYDTVAGQPAAPIQGPLAEGNQFLATPEAQFGASVAPSQAAPAQLQQVGGGVTNFDVSAPSNTSAHSLTQGQSFVGDSPFKRVQQVAQGFIDEPSAGDSDITQAALGGYNRAVKRDNYKRDVWERQQKEADEQFGKLKVEKSGESSFDASVENMAREWKGELVDLLNNKDDYDPADFTQRMHEITGRADEYQAASTAIQGVVANYGENIDKISPSTPPEIVDLLDTLYKGGGDLTVKNVNGVPSYTGTTLGGEEVEIPLSEIASGKNAIRFNLMGDHQGNMNKIVDKLGKFKSDRETEFGLDKGTLGWDQLAPQAEGEIQALVQSEADVRSVLADAYGWDYDDYEAGVAEGFDDPETGQTFQDPKEFAKHLLTRDVQNQIQTYQSQHAYKADPRAAQQLREQKFAATQQEGGPAGTAKERLTQQNLQRANEVLTADFNYNDPKSYEGLGYQSISKDSLSSDNKKKLDKRYPDGNYVILQVDGKSKVIPTGGDNARELVARSLFGIDPGELTPLKRDKSPFKRMTDWMGITK